MHRDMESPADSRNNTHPNSQIQARGAARPLPDRRAAPQAWPTATSSLLARWLPRLSLRSPAPSAASMAGGAGHVGGTSGAASTSGATFFSVFGAGGSRGSRSSGWAEAEEFHGGGSIQGTDGCVLSLGRPQRSSTAWWQRWRGRWWSFGRRSSAFALFPSEHPREGVVVGGRHRGRSFFIFLVFHFKTLLTFLKTTNR
jgi:hypothetical protein